MHLKQRNNILLLPLTVCFEANQSIQCSFRDECICGYKYTSSNKNWAWKLVELANFTDDDGVTIMAHGTLILFSVWLHCI